jgi:hypothetical protein
MDETLTLEPHEARALGVLIEKELTTPEQYPLTLNALTSGCNQKSNRDPLLELSNFAAWSDGFTHRARGSSTSGTTLASASTARSPSSRSWPSCSCEARRPPASSSSAASA